MTERPGALARAAVLAHVEHWNAVDKERWLAIFSDDVIYEDPPGTIAGRGLDVMSSYAWDRSFTDEKRWGRRTGRRRRWLSTAPPRCVWCRTTGRGRRLRPAPALHR